MSNYNHTILVGNLTKDPEVRVTESGKKMTTFTVAVNSLVRKEQGGGEVLFMPCVAFDNLAEAAGKYLDKGDPVLVTGRLREDGGSARRNSGSGVRRPSLLMDVGAEWDRFFRPCSPCALHLRHRDFWGLVLASLGLAPPAHRFGRGSRTVRNSYIGRQTTKKGGA